MSVGGAVGGVVGTVLGLGLCILLTVTLVNQKLKSKSEEDAHPVDGPVPKQMSKKATHVIPVDAPALTQVTGADFQSLCEAIREDNVLGPTGFCAIVSRCVCVHACMHACMHACVCVCPYARPTSPSP